LNNFDTNISFCNSEWFYFVWLVFIWQLFIYFKVNFEENLISYVTNLKHFLGYNQKQKENNILVHLCSNSEFVSSQKGVLLSKILIENKSFYKNVREIFLFSIEFH
jgi:hypothetical protein